jgi:hypothetical protein
LLEVGATGVQVCTPAGVPLVVAQVVASQPLPAAAAAGVHEATAVGPVVAVVQVVAV